MVTVYPMNKRSDFIAALIFAPMLGAVAGFSTLAFVKVLGFIHEFLWEYLPDKIGGLTFIYILAACLLGGLLVGLSNKHFGNWPKGLDEALEDYKKTKRFDYKHLGGGTLASFASLGFGASLGPEAALISIIGGFSTWVSDKLKAISNVSIDGLAGAVGAIFSPLGGAAIAVEETKAKTLSGKILSIAPSLLAAASGFYLFAHFSSGGFFSFNFLPYTFASGDILWSLIVVAAACALGWIFVQFETLTAKVFAPYKNQPLVLGVIGGLCLAVLAAGSSYVLFSGHEGIQEIMDEAGELTAAFLLLSALAKILATAILLDTGWKGGKFFPLMFAGAALGLALSMLLPGIAPMVGIATGIAGVLGFVLKKPLASAVLVFAFFTPNLYIFAVIGALISGSLGQKLEAK